MVEKILHVVTPELWQEIYDSYFNTHLVQLSCHPIANFIVQHLMASTTDKAQVRFVFCYLTVYLFLVIVVIISCSETFKKQALSLLYPVLA